MTNKFLPADAASWLEPRRFIICVILLSGLIFLYISTLAQTSRSSLNVMQAVSILFFTIIFLRQRGAPNPELSISHFENRSLGGLFPALAIGACIWSFSIPIYFISDDFSHLYFAREPLFPSLVELLVHGQAGTFLRPFGFAGIFLDYRLWHLWAPGYHITNILIHLATVAGLYFLCKGMNFNTRTAATASLIFAVLPINTEAIVWMGARFDLLSACLTIWTVFLYLKYRSTKHPLFYFWALVCFSFAVFSKENAYVTPFVLLSLESLIFAKRRWKPVIGFFLVAMVFLVYRWFVLGGIGGYTDASGAPATFNVGIKTLIGLFVRVPAQSLLGFNWAQPVFMEVAVLASLTSSILLITALTAKYRYIGLKRLLFCFSWILLAAVPAHPLLFINANLSNSRILYLGSAGAAVLVGQLISSIGILQTRRIIRGMLVSLLCISVLFNLSAWRYTSGLSKKLLTEISQLEPSPPPDTLFVFHNMPLSVRGVFNLHVGLRDAIRIAYNRNDLRAARHGDSAAGSGSVSSPHTVIDLEWEENGDFLLKRLGKTHREDDAGS